MADVSTDQNLPFTLQIMDSQTPPQPAPVDGVPVWASSDETVITVQAAADGMSGMVVTVAPSPTPQRVTVTADADMGAGVQTLTGVSEDINVTAGSTFEASSFIITFGAPVDKNQPTPAPGA